MPSVAAFATGRKPGVTRLAVLVGLYSVGGGVTGTIRAIEESGLLTKPAYVCHVLTPPTRGSLIRGTVDVVLAPDMPELARSAVQMFLQLKHAAHLTKQSAIVPFVIYMSENVLGRVCKSRLMDNAPSWR